MEILSSAEMIQSHYRLRIHRELRGVIRQIDRVARLTANLLKADFLALFYTKQGVSEFIPVSVYSDNDQSLLRFHLLEKLWSHSSVKESGEADFETVDKDSQNEYTAQFAKANGYSFTFNVPLVRQGSLRAGMAAFWRKQPERVDDDLYGCLQLLLEQLVDLMLTVEDVKSVDYYSMRLSELMHLFEVPLGAYRFKDFLSEIIKRSQPIIDVDGIVLLVRDQKKNRYKLQEMLCQNPLKKSFIKNLLATVEKKMQPDPRRPRRPGDWTDLSQGVDSEIGSVVAVEFSPYQGYNYVLIAIAGESKCFSQTDLELLSVLGSVSTAILRNAIMMRNIGRAKRAVEKSSNRMVDVETTAALADMTSGLAHEFNNLIGGAVGRLELIKMKMAGGDLTGDVDKIKQLLMEGAKTVKRIQEYTVSIKYKSMQPTNLCQIVKEAVTSPTASWQKLAAANNIEIEISISVNNAVIPGNHSDLVLAMEKLLQNAVEFSPSNARVKVSLGGGKEEYTIRIADNGKGISAKDKARIFYPFYSTKQGRMAGLSLSTVHGIVARHGGRVKVKDNPPQGAIFEVSFPIVEVSKDISDTTRRTRVISPRRILVVDDDRQIREVLRDLLSIQGHNLTICADGYKAVEALKKEKYDLMITDLGMPGMSGLDLADFAHENNPQMPIAMITGWGTQLKEDEVASRGIVSVMAKPFHIQDIVGLIDDLDSLAPAS